MTSGENDQALNRLALETGKRLQAAMDGNGLTQEALARATGWRAGIPPANQVSGALSPTRIAAYIQGRNCVTYEAARRFQQLWNVPDVWFMGVVSLKEAQLVALERGLTGRIYAPPDAPRPRVTPMRAARRMGMVVPLFPTIATVGLIAVNAVGDIIAGRPIF